MKNTIQTGHKIGYLNPKTGRYKFVEIVSMNEEELILLEIQKVGQRKIDNVYREKINNVLTWLKESSTDFKDGRTLLKHKPVKSLSMSEAATRYNAYLNNQN